MVIDKRTFWRELAKHIGKLKQVTGKLKGGVLVIHAAGTNCTVSATIQIYGKQYYKIINCHG